LTGTPTCIVGQTKSGPLAGHGFVSSKLAAETGATVTPAISAAKTQMSANRFTVVAPILTLGCPEETASVRTVDANPFVLFRWFVRTHIPRSMGVTFTRP
jgi:hypothetical protein